MKIEIDNGATLKSKIDFAHTCIVNAYRWPEYKLHWLKMAANQIEDAIPFLQEEIGNCDVEEAEQLIKDNLAKSLKSKRLIG